MNRRFSLRYITQPPWTTRRRTAPPSDSCLKDSLPSNNGFGDLYLLRPLVPVEEDEIGLFAWSQSALASCDASGSSGVYGCHRYGVPQREASRPDGVTNGAV